jgi:DNA-binding CsgD family transcriptional regulator
MIRFAQVHRTLTTRSHEQLIAPREWRRSTMFNEYFRQSHIDDRLLTICKLPDGGGDAPTGEHGVSLYRATGDRPFTERDRRLVHLVYEELRPLVGTKLETCRGRELRALSPRLKRVLDLLLLGYSDKEIAARCNLARPTAREYITTIYRRYGGSSRAHLLALFLRWQGDGPAK